MILEIIEDIDFENNLMPKLHEEYHRTKMIIPFDMEKVTRPRNQGGFGIAGWKESFLEARLEHTAQKRKWIEKVDDKKYRLTELGTKWEPSWSARKKD
jgi:hypothetical protein